MQGKTVIEAFPESEQADVYRRLAKNILENRSVYIPNPITMDDIKRILIKVFN
jgi:nitrogenase iron protein NifH